MATGDKIIIARKDYVDTKDSTHVTNDDHTQYHNDTRGDARYYTKAQVDTAISANSTSYATTLKFN